jgi:hypothetical protein
MTHPSCISDSVSSFNHGGGAIRNLIQIAMLAETNVLTEPNTSVIFFGIDRSVY